ncbi:FGGY-family carbohydrate kinase, partial [Acidocella sp. MX-AZ02]|uniref:FGGY-family carbohydrate kinase n=1 Tax=Acidocella sp. MX-AZ02 TaxID=1214225 RepID=UPI00028D30FC
MSGLIVVLDIGKTNAKLLLLDAAGSCLWSAERASPALPAPDMAPLTRQLDVAGIEDWALATLATMPGRKAVRAIVPIAHGAAMVLLDAAGTRLLAPDYEDPAFTQTQPAYRAQRPPFAETLSPALPAGLNLGAQIFFVQQRLPALFARTSRLLTYPQYWSWRFSGMAASEVTSLGCHTDLWAPQQGEYSRLVAAQGWEGLLAPLRPAATPLGRLRPALAASLGLPATCQVICGIHDSNASYLAHRIGRPPAAPFCVLSSGTWCVILASGAKLDGLDEAADMLANVDALGVPTATARFMGGREYAAIAGTETPPTLAGLDEMLTAGAMALPGFALGGPFPGRAGRLLAADALSPPARAALASLYCALMADYILERLQGQGPVLVDGPFAANPLF